MIALSLKINGHGRAKKYPDADKVMYSLLVLCFLMFLLLAVMIICGQIKGPAAVSAAVIGIITVCMSGYCVLLMMRMFSKLDTYEENAGDLEALNKKLRAQRHDFKNHMQVISGLLEMGEIAEARGYIARVNSDIMRVGRALRTSKPSVNALLEAKSVMCERKGIKLTLSISSPLENLPVESWEYCRVLGNLADNAIDAASCAEAGEVRIAIEEKGQGLLLKVANNGSTIADSMRGDIFEPGTSTKGEGRGMGLSIVKMIAESCGGSVSFSSAEGITVFEVFLPLLKSAAQTV